ncbi:hypothetical protein BaRGS_00040550 [Batillaria attramentaria]|uniref:Uncharacterized protein n=1 Tax=Batillaria attramentaria TaxID=370345 RepID=A0ABD0IZV1_9CAEN
MRIGLDATYAYSDRLTKGAAIRQTMQGQKDRQMHGEANTPTRMISEVGTCLRYTLIQYPARLQRLGHETEIRNRTSTRIHPKTNHLSSLSGAKKQLPVHSRAYLAEQREDYHG